MAKNYTAPQLEKIIEDIGNRLQRVESRNPISVGSSLFGGALSYSPNGGLQVNAITINGPGGQSVLTLPKLGDLVPTGFSAVPSWETGLLVGASGSSVVDVDWNPAVGVGADQIVAWQVRLQIVGDPFTTDYTYSDHPQRIRNLKPGANYVAYISPVDQFGNITNVGGASATFTAAFNTNAPAWQSANANVLAQAAYTTVTVTWSDDTDDPDVGAGNGTYDVQIATDNLFTQNIQNLRVSGTICTFTGLTTGTTYYVRVRAVNNSGYAGSDGVQNQWIVFGGATPQGVAPGQITGALATDITVGAVRNTQQTYLVTAGINNPATPAASYSLGSDGNLALSANGASGTPLNRVTDLAAFDGVAIKYNAANTGGKPRTTGPFYTGLQPGKYKAVFYLKSTSSGIPATQPILSVFVQGVSGNVLESGQAVVVTADQLGNAATGTATGACDGVYHAVAIPLTVVRDWTGNDSGLELVANAAYGTMNWSLSHVSIVPFTALVQNEITSNYIASNAVVAGKIAANAVTAESLSIKATTPYRNLNYDFEDAGSLNSSLPSHWTPNYDFASGTGNGPANIYLAVGFAYSGANSLAIAATKIDATHFTGGAIASDAFTVNPGEVLTVDGWLLQNNAALTGGAYVRVWFGTTANFLPGDPTTTSIDVPGLSGAGNDVLPANTWVSVAQIAASFGGNNLLTSQDSSFENPGVGTWQSVGGAATLAHSTAQAYIGSSCMAITANSTGQVVVRTDVYPFSPGVAGRASMAIRAGSTSRLHSVRVEYVDGNGNVIGYFQNFVADTSAGWLTCTASGVAPAGTTGARVVIYGGGTVANGEVHYIDNVSLLAAAPTNNQVTVPQGKFYARVGAYMFNPAGISNGQVATLYVDRLVISGAVLGTTIANGAIATAHIMVGSLDADRITAGTITATQIKAGAIDATKIKALSITAPLIAGGTITGDKIAGQQIVAGHLAVQFNLTVGGQAISASYAQGNSGWTIQQNGYAEFNNVAIRGVLYAATFGGPYFDFKAVGGNDIALRVAAGSQYSTLQLGQGMVNVGAYIGWDPTISQMQYIGYYNIGDVATFKFINGFVEADNFRSVSAYALGHWADNGIQGYFIGNDNPGGSNPPWDSAFGMQIEKRGGLFNTFVQAWMDSDARHCGLRNMTSGIQQVYIDGFQGDTRSLTRTGWVTYSDERAKADLRAMELDKAATAGAVIQALKPLRYSMKLDRQHTKKPREHLGFGAEEVLEVLPEAVHFNVYHHQDQAEDKHMGISYDTFIPVLVQHNQEQQVEIDELRAEIKALKKLVKAAPRS